MQSDKICKGSSDSDNNNSEKTASNRFFGTKITLTGKFNHHKSTFRYKNYAYWEIKPPQIDFPAQKLRFLGDLTTIAPETTARHYVQKDVIGKKELICKTHIVFCSTCGKHHLKGQHCGGWIAIQKGKIAKQKEEEKRVRKTKAKEDFKNEMKGDVKCMFY